MLNAAGKVTKILRREGATGIVNRLRYRRDNALMRDSGDDSRRCFVLLGKGQLRTSFHTELRRHGLLARGRGPLAAQKILFNPLPVELDDTSIAAVVLDDAYLASIRPADLELIAGLTSGCHVLVRSQPAVERALAMGVARQNLILLPPNRGAGAMQMSIARWLVYANLLKPEVYLQAVLKHGPTLRNRDRVCISLPEHAERRAMFQSGTGTDFVLIDGVRMLPGWKGCAWSYKTIASKALQSGAKRLTICEDDACFSPNFTNYFKALNRYLDRA